MDVSELKVHFYDFQSGIKITNKIDDAFDGIVNNVNLDLQRHLNIYIPGYRSNSDDSPETALRQALKDVPNIYLIVFDYSYYSAERLTKESLEKTMPYIFDLGSAMGKFVARLHELGFKAEKIRGFGHSAGGQLVGVMGEAFKNTTGTKIARITSIDPAKQCFSEHLETHTRSGQAEFVEVIHCESRNYGSLSNHADADIYYNKEDAVYPGCYDNNKNKVRNLGEVDMVTCAHIFCVQEYMRTVSQPKWFKACADYDDYVKHGCANSEIVYSGYYHNNTSKGIFYASTKVGPRVVPIA